MRTLTLWTSTTALALLTLVGCSGDADEPSDSEVQQFMGPLVPTPGMTSPNAMGDMGAVPAVGDNQDGSSSQPAVDNMNGTATNENGNDSADSETTDTMPVGTNNTASTRPNRGSMVNNGNPDTDTDNSNEDPNDTEDELDEVDPVDENDQDDPGNQQPEPEQPTLDVEFAELYQTIFLDSCNGNNCHGTDAPRAPFAANTEQFAYEVITGNAESILERLQGINGNIMPRGCGNGLDNGRCLSQEQFDAVQAWVDAGLPR